MFMCKNQKQPSIVSLMPYIVPNRAGTFGKGARGFTAYDNKGNFWGYFPSGRIPQCSIANFVLDPNCPVGALTPSTSASCGCRNPGPNGCYPASVVTCPTGYQCVAFSYAPWGSCNINSGILF